MTHTKHSGSKWILLIFCGCCILTILLLVEIFYFPRYLNLSIPPPLDRYGQGEWSHTTYSLFQVTAYVPILNKRSYIRRQDTFVASDHINHKNESWESVISYFDGELVKYGWIRHNLDVSVFVPCDIYLPEAQFIHSGNNGYVYYVKKNYEKYAPYGEEYFGDLICLAVWSSAKDQNGLPVGYNVVFLTAKKTWSAFP